MDGQVIDWQDLDEAFKPIAAEKPGHVSECRYYEWISDDRRGKPVCAVAVILDVLGVVVPVSAELDIAASPLVLTFFSTPDFEGRFTPAARVYLNELQSIQDDGKTWEEAWRWAGWNAERVKD